LPLQRHDTLEQEVVLGGDFGAPAVLDHDGLMRLDDDGGAAYRVAGRKLLADEHRGLVPFPARIKFGPARGGGEGGARRRRHRLGELRAPADRLDRHRFDDQLLAIVDESEPRFVRGLEGGFHLREGEAEISEA